jgi:tRNA/tmRNA/rRNA uracil-C5-methylase (TrmA/RlmC/RlmD family)
VDTGITGDASTSKLAVGDRVTVEIGNVAHGGHFIARHNGQVIFVRHGITGEKAVVEITATSSKVVRGDVVEVVEASPARVNAPCQYAHPQGCGGCDFQHIDISFQRELKRRVVIEQFSRIGGLEIDLDVKSVEPLNGLHWRTRMDFAISKSGHPGLYAHRSNEVIEIEDCLLAVPEMKVPEITARKWNGSERLELAVSSEGQVNLSRAGRSISGATQLKEVVNGLTYKVSAQSFWQGHRNAPSVLVKQAMDLLTLQDADVVCDLYGGAGLFAASMSKRVGASGKVHLIELDAHATKDAKSGFALTKNVEVHVGKVENELRKITRADVLLLDPPRTGAGKEVVDEMLRIAPRTIVYVSCDPSSLARDAKYITEGGYEISFLVGYDLFPMTSHVECVVQFTCA